MGRQIGDILYLNWNNQYFGEPCKIIEVNNKKGSISYNVELLNKQDSWLRAEEGKKVTLTFSDVHYCNLKETLPVR